MISYTGNTLDTFISPKKNLPFVLENFSIVNKTGGAVSINVYKVINDNSLYCIAPFSQSVSANQSYQNLRPTVLLAYEQIKLEASGNVDYDFTLKNMTFDK